MPRRNSLKISIFALIILNLYGCNLFKEDCAEYPTELPDVFLPKMKVDSMYSYDVSVLVEKSGFLIVDKAEIIETDTTKKYGITIYRMMYSWDPYFEIYSHNKGSDISFKAVAISPAQNSCKEQRATFKVVIPEIY